MSQPTVYGGPAILLFGGFSFYPESSMDLSIKRTTWDRKSAFAGTIAKIMKSQVTEITFTPTGVLDVVAKYLPYALSKIGGFLFNNTPCVVWTKSGFKETWANAAITKMPGFRAGPTGPIWSGTMTITCLGDSSKTLTDPAAYNAITSVAFADATFDETKFFNAPMTAALGARSAPFNAMQSIDGFAFDFGMQPNFVEIANYGTVNAILEDLTAAVKFKPANLDSTDIYTLINLQNTGAIQPGDNLSKSAESLVITGGGGTFTLNNAGPMAAATHYGLNALRGGEVGFVAAKTWTTGSINPLFTLTPPS